jgi:hypothetical protein
MSTPQPNIIAFQGHIADAQSFELACNLLCNGRDGNAALSRIASLLTARAVDPPQLTIPVEAYIVEASAEAGIFSPTEADSFLERRGWRHAQASEAVDLRLGFPATAPPAVAVLGSSWQQLTSTSGNTSSLVFHVPVFYKNAGWQLGAWAGRSTVFSSFRYFLAVHN